jgi:thioester reductase-like protein
MLLMTGATGSVGVELVRLLLERKYRDPVCLLIRAGSEDALRQRWARLLAIASRGDLQPEDVPQFRPVLGDITRPRLGLSARQIGELRREATAALHIAANVNFDDPLDLCREINVEGTRNFLDLCCELPHLERVGNVSSCYVAGRRSGPVLERELQHDAGFVTFGYEQSKYEAELLGAEYLDRLPLATYRMSLMLGRAEDGYVHDYGAIHRFLQFMYQGIAPCLPGYADCPLDFLPNDYSAQCLTRLFLDHFESGQTYQISAGKKSISASRWMDLTAETYARFSPRWRKGVYVRPDMVEWAHYRLYVKTVDTIDNPGLMKVTRVLDSCAEELFCPKVFDRENTDRALGTSWDDVPDYEVYYPKILAHCIEAKWGADRRMPAV